MGTDRQIIEQLNKMRCSKTLIVGIGNTLKGDDGAGPLVCERLAGKVGAEFMNVGTVPENYIQPIIKKAPRNLIVIDAVDFGASPGTIKVFRPEQLDSFVISTHTLSPHLFVDMVCQGIKVEVCFLGIQPAQSKLGQSISPQVSQAVRRLSQTIIGVFPLEE